MSRRLPVVGKLSISKLSATLAVLAGLLVVTEGLGSAVLYDTGVVIAICFLLVLGLRAIVRRVVARFLAEGWFGRVMVVTLVLATVSLFSVWGYLFFLASQIQGSDG